MKRIMAMVFVGVFLISGVANANLIAHYSFDGHTNDLSGNGNHATAHNNYSYESGIIGDAIHLVGSGHTGLSGGHVLLPTFSFNMMDEFTIAIWVNYQGHTTVHDESFISFGRSTFNNSIYGINYSLDQERIGYSAGGPWTAGVSTVGTQFPTDFQNNWHHLALRIGNGVMTGFLDGQENAWGQTLIISFVLGVKP